MNEAVDWDKWKVLLDVFQWLVTLGIALYVGLDRGRKNNSQKLQQMDNRLTSIESELSHMPDKDKVTELSTCLAGVMARLEALGPQLQRLENKTDMLLENELRGNKQ